MKALMVVISAGSGVVNFPASLLGTNAVLLFALIDGISDRPLHSKGLLFPRTD